MTDFDETEKLRRERLAELNGHATQDRAEAEGRYGQVWNTDEMTRDFEPLGFMAPYIVVRRRSDGKRGSLEFQHLPRFYFGWREE